MIPRWEGHGHIVLVVNLKGKRQGISSSEVLQDVAKQIYDTVKQDDFYNLRSLYLQKCLTSIPKSGSYSLVVICLSSLVTFLFTYAALFLEWKDTVSRRALFSCLVSIVAGGGLYFWFEGHGQAMEVLEPLHGSISDGNWETLACVCNGIATLKPENRPILIVREFANLEEQSRLDLLRSFEQSKEGQRLFPAILETSDYMWLEDSPVRKSSDSFKEFHLEEMSYGEGKTELVDKYKIWNHNEFTAIYELSPGRTWRFLFISVELDQRREVQY